MKIELNLHFVVV